MAKGYIKLHRQIQDCQIWVDEEPFDMRSAWIDLLMLANHRDKDIIFDYKPLTIKRGQYLTSVRKLGARWSWSKNRVLKYLKLLERLKMIERESSNQRTLLTIVNYEIYQGSQDTDMDTDVDTSMDTPMDTGMPQTIMIKNDKNEKKYISAFDEFWKLYPRKKDKARAYKCYIARLNDGYTEEQLLTACRNYAAECEHNKTEERFIKHGATFLSVNEPFLDYLKEKGDTDVGVGTDTSRDEAEYERQVREQLKRIESGELDDESLF